jgi:hypothetical protein
MTKPHKLPTLLFLLGTTAVASFNLPILAQEHSEHRCGDSSTDSNPNPSPQAQGSKKDDVNTEVSTYGSPVPYWYEGEESPRLFLGHLKRTKNAYLFNTKANQSTNTKSFIIKFYDEDAEKEAIDIARNYKTKENNIKLLGYISKKDSNNIEVIYGLSPNQCWEELIPSNKK